MHLLPRQAGTVRDLDKPQCSNASDEEHSLVTNQRMLCLDETLVTISMANNDRQTRDPRCQDIHFVKLSNFNRESIFKRPPFICDASYPVADKSGPSECGRWNHESNGTHIIPILLSFERTLFCPHSTLSGVISEPLPPLILLPITPDLTVKYNTRLWSTVFVSSSALALSAQPHVRGALFTTRPLRVPRARYRCC